MSTEEVLNQIATALHDREVSPDAMRSKPPAEELVIEPTFHPAYVVPPQRQPVHDTAPAPAPYPASRRQVVPLLAELAGRGLTWLLRRNR